jgi:hypothetical protein
MNMRRKSSKSSKSSKSRSRRSRSKRGGGFVFGGLPQNIKLGFDNLTIGAKNMYRGFMGTNQLNSASPWNQPALNAKMGPTAPKFSNIAGLAANAKTTVAKVMA